MTSTTAGDNKKYLGVWLDKDFYDRLSAMAKSNERPLSNEVRRALRTELEKFESEEKPDSIWKRRDPNPPRYGNTKWFGERDK